MKPDVLVIGGGIAGAVFAIFVANAGYKVLILDRQKEDDIGRRIGGEAIDKAVFAKTGIPAPEGPELLAEVDQLSMVSPDGKTTKRLTFPTVVVDRHKFAQRLLAYARRAGAEVRGDAEIEGVLLERDQVAGVELANGERLYARLVVEASGVKGVLRHQLPASWGIERHVDEVALGYKEIRTGVKMPSDMTVYFSLPGTYLWHGPADLGVGTMHADPRPDAMLGDFFSARGIYGDVVASDQGHVPLRSPLPNLVADGLLVIGDAACMVNTSNGTGIATGMMGALMAGNVAVESLQAGDLSRNALWTFNVRYHRGPGATLAYSDALRRYFQTLEPHEIDFLFQHDLVTSGDLATTMSGGVIKLPLGEKMARGLRGASNPGLLLGLEQSMNRAEGLLSHCERYPERPSDYADWHATLLKKFY